MNLSRRELLLSAAGVGVGAAGVWTAGRLTGPYAESAEPPGAPPHEADSAVVSPESALQKLSDGNRRFVEGKLLHPNQSPQRRAEVAQAQHPYAVVLGCADSRVAPEIVFDGGLGDLFVIREAGHVADAETLGSIEYAAAHLHVPLVVVLGHRNCGAVKAAVGSVLRDEPAPGHVLRLVDGIASAVVEVKNKPGDMVDNAVRANVRMVVRQIQSSGPILRPLVRKDTVRVVGAYYDLQSGRVEWLKDA